MAHSPQDRRPSTQASGRARAERIEHVRVQAARARIREREAAFQRLSRTRVWAAGGAGALSLLFAGLAYGFAPGHKLHKVTASSATGSGSAASAPKPATSNGSSQQQSSSSPASQASSVQAPSSPPAAATPPPAPQPQVVVGGS